MDPIRRVWHERVTKASGQRIRASKVASLGRGRGTVFPDMVFLLPIDRFLRRSAFLDDLDQPSTADAVVETVDCEGICCHCVQ